MPRALTDAEFATLTTPFPGLTRADVQVTGEADDLYNCIAFSLGFTDRWINPPQPLDAFQALYSTAHGHPVLTTHDATAEIDGWATPGPTMTHGSRVDGGRWQSKLGSFLRITHPRDGLDGPAYGKVVTSFGQARRILMAAHERETGPLSRDEVDRMRHLASMVDPDVKEGFDSAIAAWREAIETDGVRLSSDSRDYATGPAYESIVGLGPAALPLLVEYMALHPKGFFLLPALRELSPSRALLEGTDGSGPPLESQQSRARRALRGFLDAG